MSFNRIRLNDLPQNNLSFSHQHSLSQQQESKHKKKISLHPKQPKFANQSRTKTQQHQHSRLIKPDHLQSSFAFKSSKQKFKIIQSQDARKIKKSKGTISVIDLTKGQKNKGSNTVTKRKQSNVDLSHKIKQKIEDFRILSKCLQQYVKQQRKNKSQASIAEVLKIISAFNRSQIAPLSKPLQKLISQIMYSIKYSLPQPHLKSILRESSSFESPNKHKIQKQQQPGTVKKKLQKNKLKQYPFSPKQQMQIRPLQQNLGRLKYQSNRLKYFLQDLSPEGKDKKRQFSSKQAQLLKLQQIVAQQDKMIEQLQECPEETFRE